MSRPVALQPHARYEILCSSQRPILRRRLLDEVGLILDEASEALRKLQENLSEGLNHMSSKPGPNPYWEEVREIDTLYRELLATVGGAGLSIRPKTPSNTARLPQHELEALTA